MGATSGGYVSRRQVVTAATSVANSTEIPYQDVEAGSIEVTAGEAVVTLTFHGATKQGGTFTPIYSTANAAITMTVAHTRAYPFPAECRGFAAIKITGNVAGALVVCTKAIY